MSNRTRKLRVALAFSTVVSLAGGLAAALIVSHARDAVPVAALALLFVAILGTCFAAMLPWWRGLDHMQRDSHLTSWFWGGSFGGGLGVLLIVLVDRGPGPMAQGATLIWAAQFVGYGIAFIGWKIAHGVGDA